MQIFSSFACCAKCQNIEAIVAEDLEAADAGEEVEALVRPRRSSSNHLEIIEMKNVVKS